MSKVSSYTILIGDPVTVSISVNKALDTGWELYGSPHVDHLVVAQAMVKPASQEAGDELRQTLEMLVTAVAGSRLATIIPRSLEEARAALAKGKA